MTFLLIGYLISVVICLIFFLTLEKCRVGFVDVTGLLFCIGYSIVPFLNVGVMCVVIYVLIYESIPWDKKLF